ncbi:hypothetical protein [Halococcoides cellulosivorans]|uniref:Uncharacterized protein n=1 Tax=Halococcoides cellulosivorans TaxID=1679096 RepID=A0A2R4WYB6_9EURY|nr:hypothetical protein [Halococcoides cellulosivorans]AWB26534.1 hypothetical protein HARCEL1_01805 [Halococcoides cellulosivorans]
MYRLAIKESAREANDAVADLVADRGDVLDCESEGAAQALAERVSAAGERVRVQAAAPQDSSDADGYLIRHPRRYVSDPKPSDTTGLTFDVGANQYGALGEALVCGTSGLARGIKHVLRNELDDVIDERHYLYGIPDPYITDDLDADVSWSPDLLVLVGSEYQDNPVAMYYCEIKTGDASFQRTQADDMQAVAREYGVLKIRVIVEALPDEYTLEVSEVQAD